MEETRNTLLSSSKCHDSCISYSSVSVNGSEAVISIGCNSTQLKYGKHRETIDGLVGTIESKCLLIRYQVARATASTCCSGPHVSSDRAREDTFRPPVTRVANRKQRKVRTNVANAAFAYSLQLHASSVLQDFTLPMQSFRLLAWSPRLNCVVDEKKNDFWLPLFPFMLDPRLTRGCDCRFSLVRW